MCLPDLICHIVTLNGLVAGVSAPNTGGVAQMSAPELCEGAAGEVTAGRAIDPAG